MEKQIFNYFFTKMSSVDVCKYTLCGDDVFVNDVTDSLLRTKDANSKTLFFNNFHTLDFYSVTWIEQGDFDLIVDMDKKHIPNKSVLFLVPGKLYRIANATSDLISGISINFSEEYFCSLNPLWAHFVKFDIMQKACVLPIRNHDTRQRIKELISLLKANQGNTDVSICSKALTYSALTVLMCVLSKADEFVYSKNSTSPLNVPNHALYLSFVDKIEHNFRLHHTVKFYTEELGVSYNLLNNCCKDNIGVTALNVINERIMMEAKRLLLFSEKRINEISQVLGFDEPSHFNVFFRKHMAMSPNRFRKLTLTSTMATTTM